MSRSAQARGAQQPPGSRAPSHGYAGALREREYAGLLVARVTSEWGDHIARIALAAYVLSSSDSALLSALVFGVSFLPSAVGQAVLSPLADRFPRRGLLLAAISLRAVLVCVVLAVVAARGSVTTVLALVFLVELVGSPTVAATQALVHDVLDDHETFLSGNSLMMLAGQANQVVGLLVGGVVVAALDVESALWLDVATFVAAGVVIAALTRSRPAADQRRAARFSGVLADTGAGARVVRGDPSLSALAALAFGMTVVLVAPEAVALPYAVAHGAGPRTGALLMAAVPFGAAVGVAVVNRWAPLTQVERMLPLAALGTLPLLAVAADPPWPVAAVLFLLSGFCQAFLAPLLGTFTALAPDHLRARVNGLAAAVFSLLTAIGWPLVGALADLTSPATAVACGGLAGLLLVAVRWRRWPADRLRSAALATYGDR